LYVIYNFQLICAFIWAGSDSLVLKAARIEHS